MATIATRSATLHYVFGQCGPLPKNQLPQSIDVIRYGHYLRNTDLSKVTLLDCVDEIITALLEIWQRAFIPTISPESAKKKLCRLSIIKISLLLTNQKQI